mmetsp:Transcript_21529/g.35671  ORF Transcript_21529/g.35671 Transcript_21529/m.35671 type:complete len:362 (-) Transcript_21529:43-1128(-)
MYVAGCPGTGKTLVLDHVKKTVTDWETEENRIPSQIIQFNAMRLTQPQAIFETLATELLGEKRSAKAAIPLLEEYICSRPAKGKPPRMILAIIDEIDQLLCRGQEILYRLFQWTALKGSRLILIGIANSLDLTERFVPLLESENIRPVVTIFNPYKKDDLVEILKQRLRRATSHKLAQALNIPPMGLFEEAALELCARKVSTSSGDVRKTLDICRQAVMAMELRFKDSVLPSDMPIIKCDTMNRILQDCYSSPCVGVIRALPQQHQLVLCAAALSLRKKPKEFTISKLCDSYKSLCQRTHMQPLYVAEVVEVCDALGAHALLNVGPAKENRLRKVALSVRDEDIEFAMSEDRFFASIIATS